MNEELIVKVVTTKLPGVLIIEPPLFSDERGYFFEIFNVKRYQEHGIATDFVQDNFSFSRKNVVRGLHYQITHPQGKMVFVVSGRVMDVIVDVRQGSSTFGQSITVELSGDSQRQVYIPPGFAHGFCVLSNEAHFIYKCTDYYDHAGERGVYWNDPDLQIPWPVQDPILSVKDKASPYLKDIAVEQLPTY
jgi:dTDP-4-dehydrorhamnose 3,5-epimerase